MNRVAGKLVAVVAVALGGCGGIMATDYPERLIGAEGQEFFLEELAGIADNENLTDDEKREQFRELGIRDEELIDALLSL